MKKLNKETLAFIKFFEEHYGATFVDSGTGERITTKNMEENDGTKD